MNIINIENFPEITLENSQIYGMGKGGGGDAPTEEDDTLSARQTVRALLLISEGPIKGDVEVYLNNIKSTSFKNVSFEVRNGLDSQDVIDGFSKTESPLPISDTPELKYSVPIIREVTIPQIDAVRITLVASALTQVDEDYNVIGTTVSFDVETRKNSFSTWNYIKTITITGKSRNPYPWSFRVKRPDDADPNVDSWQVRIKRVTPDDNPTNRTSSKTSWVSTIQIQNETQTYPNSALVGLTAINSARLGSTIPNINIRAKGLKLKVPSSLFYNAEARTYNNHNWDGTWQPSLYYNNCPAWCLFNILIHPRWGLGEYIKEENIDIYSFWEFAEYCDELVDDGKGGTEHRYSMDNQFMSRDNISTFLMYFLTIGNANLTINKFGLIKVVFDKPENLDNCITIGNNEVVDGIFEYVSSGIEDRYTQVNVTWNNPKYKGKTDTVTWPLSTTTEFEDNFLDLYGFRPTDVILVGCMSERQALWKAKWVYYTNLIQTEIVVFRQLFAALNYEIGEVIKILDEDSINNSRAAKILSFEHTNVELTHMTITLDRDIDLPSGSFEVSFYSFTSVVTYPITEFSTTTNTLHIEHTDIIASPYLNTDAYIVGDIQATTWRITDIEVDTETQIHTITAVQYDINKYAYIEEGLTLEEPIYYGLPLDSVAQVEDISVERDIYKLGDITKTNLDIKWLWFQSDDVKTLYLAEHAAWELDPESGPEPMPKNSEKVAYNVSYRRNNGNYVSLETTYSMSAAIEDALYGSYDIKIIAVSSTGLESIASTFTYNYNLSGGSSTLQPPINLYVEGTTDTEYTSETLKATFQYNTANDAVTDKLSSYIVEVYTSDGVTLKNSYPVALNSDKSGTFIYTFTQNSTDFGSPTRDLMLKVYSVDTVGNLSTDINAIFTNPQEAAITFTVEMGADVATVNLPVLSGDRKGYLVHMSQTNDFSPSGANKQYEGSDTKIPIYLPTTGLYYFKACAFDNFGQDSLNYGTQVSATTVGLPAIKIEPATLTQVLSEYTTNIVSMSDGVLTTILSVDFTALQPAGTDVNLLISCGGACPIATDKIVINVEGTDHVLYDKSGQGIQTRAYSGVIVSSVTVPGDGIYTIMLKARQNSGSTVNFEDPYIVLQETKA